MLKEGYDKCLPPPKFSGSPFGSFLHHSDGNQTPTNQTTTNQATTNQATNPLTNPPTNTQVNHPTNQPVDTDENITSLAEEITSQEKDFMGANQCMFLTMWIFKQALSYLCHRLI